MQVTTNLTFIPGQIGLNLEGNVVNAVPPGTQAFEAGVKLGWLVTAVQGTPMPNDRNAIIAATRKCVSVGKPVTITFSHKQKKDEKRKGKSSSESGSDSDDKQKNTGILHEILKSKSPENGGANPVDDVQAKKPTHKFNGNIENEQNSTSKSKYSDLKDILGRKKKENHHSKRKMSRDIENIKKEKERRRNEPKRSIVVDGFIRPLSTKSVERLFSEFGEVKTFWISQIKDHCYVVYANPEEAKAAYEHVQGLRFPEDDRPPLTCNLCHIDDVEEAKKSKKGRKKRKVKPTARLDKLFKKTQTKPQIYWAPRSVEEIAKTEELDARVRARREARQQLGQENETQYQHPRWKKEEKEAENQHPRWKKEEKEAENQHPQPQIIDYDKSKKLPKQWA